MSKLITTSLISAVDWLKNCPYSYKEKAYKDLFNQLARIYPKEMPKPIKRGIDFENTLQRVVESDRIKEINSSEKFKEVCNYCKGGIFQQKSKSFVMIDKVEYCLYGRIDIKFPSKKLIDIKTTSKYKESSYLNSFQHRIYCHNEGIKAFEYVVVIFDDNDKIIDVKYLPVVIENFTNNFEEIKAKIIEVINFISLDDDLLKLYNTKFSRY